MTYPTGVASSSTGTGTSGPNIASTSVDEEEGDIMQSNWGADVFEMVTIIRLPSYALNYNPRNISDRLLILSDLRSLSRSDTLRSCLPHAMFCLVGYRRW